MARVADDRGQLILLAAFALAVIFVTLALVVNSAIYTENLAARGEGGATAEALSERHAIEDELGDVMTEINEYNASSWSTLRGLLGDAVENTTRIAGVQQAAQGRYLHVEPGSYDEGTRIADNTSGGSTFEGAGGADRWTVATAGATRAFVLNVSRSSVTGGSDTFGGASADEFEVNVTNGGADWVVNLTDRGGTFTVGVSTPGGDTATCVASGTSSFVAVDLTAGTVGGRECPALTFAEGVSGTYDVRYNNSDRVTGNYSLVIGPNDYANAELEPSPGAGDPGDPYARVALYAATVGYRYDAPTIHYETDVRVAPGETDG